MIACLAAVQVPMAFFIIGLISLALIAASLLAAIFGPSPEYKLTGTTTLPAIHSPEFLKLVEALTDAEVNHNGHLEVLTNGPEFYPAMLEAIHQAQRSINIEAYIFARGEIGAMYLKALAERARAGVQVNLMLDAFGSAMLLKSYFAPVTEAGGKVRWYNKPTWYRMMRVNNRTHRELMIVDGKIGFIGGAGIADQWWKGVKKHPRWRDTMVRVRGNAVWNLQATFAENWLAASGELLVGEMYFPDIEADGSTAAMVVNSTPTVGGSTRARILFQLLVAGATKSIHVTTPYFLPDRSLMDELCRAVKRGVQVRILVPGVKSDHLLTRSTSRGGYGPLLKAGAEIYEYQPAMIHAKILCVDGLWSVVGSTNFDYRSFGINDEVNLAISDGRVTARLEQDMEKDLTESCRVSLEDWKHRSLRERAPELLGWILERQQ